MATGECVARQSDFTEEIAFRDTRWSSHRNLSSWQEPKACGAVAAVGLGGGVFSGAVGDRESPAAVVLEAAVDHRFGATGDWCGGRCGSGRRRGGRRGGGRRRGYHLRADLQRDVVHVHGCEAARAVVVGTEVQPDCLSGVVAEVELVMGPQPVVGNLPDQRAQPLAIGVQHQHILCVAYGRNGQRIDVCRHPEVVGFLRKRICPEA